MAQGRHHATGKFPSAWRVVRRRHSQTCSEVRTVLVSLAPDLLTDIHFQQVGTLYALQLDRKFNLVLILFLAHQLSTAAVGTNLIHTVWTSYEQHLSRYPIKVGK